MPRSFLVACRNQRSSLLTRRQVAGIMLAASAFVPSRNVIRPLDPNVSRNTGLTTNMPDRRTRTPCRLRLARPPPLIREDSSQREPSSVSGS
ncbi:hypothetical protein DMB42_34575 [Nonomuraea sp. WAC 01424]|nr:hypothetical protein DMB42_34575 [Nonomuraea sp. WAC 01424]